MHITCDRAALSKSFSVAASVSKTHTPSDAYKSILLEAADKGAFLTGTDGEVQVRVKLKNVEIHEEGQVLLNTERIKILLQSLTIDTLEIKTKGSNIRLVGEGFHQTIPSISPEDFPAMQIGPDGDQYIIDSKRFREMIVVTSFAIDKDSKSFPGVAMEVDGNCFRTIGTDGRRLSVAMGESTLLGEQASGVSVAIISAKSLKVMASVLANCMGDAALTFRDSSFSLECGDFVVSSTLLVGEVPPWRRTMPDNWHPNPVTIDAGALHTAVCLAKTTTGEDSMAVNLDFGNEELKITSSAADIGSSVITSPVNEDSVTGDVSLNPDYVLDFLKALPRGSEIDVHLQGEEKPVIFSAGKGFSKSHYLVMPIAKA